MKSLERLEHRTVWLTSQSPVIWQCIRIQRRPRQTDSVPAAHRTDQIKDRSASQPLMSHGPSLPHTHSRQLHSRRGALVVPSSKKTEPMAGHFKCAYQIYTFLFHNIRNHLKLEKKNNYTNKWRYLDSHSYIHHQDSAHRLHHCWHYISTAGVDRFFVFLFFFFVDGNNLQILQMITIQLYVQYPWWKTLLRYQKYHCICWNTSSSWTLPLGCSHYSR